jgi:hypothetical protein
MKVLLEMYRQTRYTKFLVGYNLTSEELIWIVNEQYNMKLALGERSSMNPSS